MAARIVHGRPVRGVVVLAILLLLGL